MRPLIGLTCEFETRPDTGRDRNYLNAAYADAVYAAGGLPFPLAMPPRFDAELAGELLARCDALIFTGGYDVSPARYGAAPHEKTEPMHARRDAFEIDFFRAAAQADKPVLSICLGCQVAGVARGGKLVQHLDDGPAVTVQHHLPAGRSAFHAVRIDPGSLLARVVGASEIEVNSRHHQAVRADALGSGLAAVAFAPDGVVEAVEDRARRFMLAVQWHPEDMIDRPEHLRLFEALVRAARER
jgi:putative glutamine amidotransferase